MVDVRQILADFQNGIPELTQANPEFMGAFMNLNNKAFQDGVLPAKTKELIAIGVGVYNRCQYCIVAHVHGAYQAGCTREEIIDAAMTVIGGFGGGPSLAYSSAVLMAAVNEFEKDFK